MTAVEYFAKQDTKLTIDFLENKLNQIELAIAKTKLLQQAIQMNEKELFNFWNGGINSTEVGGKSFDQYYNETFKK